MSQIEAQEPRDLQALLVGTGLDIMLKSMPAESPKHHTEFLFCALEQNGRKNKNKGSNFVFIYSFTNFLLSISFSVCSFTMYMPLAKDAQFKSLV